MGNTTTKHNLPTHYQGKRFPVPIVMIATGTQYNETVHDVSFDEEGNIAHENLWGDLGDDQRKTFCASINRLPYRKVRPVDFVLEVE